MNSVAFKEKLVFDSLTIHPKKLEKLKKFK